MKLFTFTKRKFFQLLLIIAILFVLVNIYITSTRKEDRTEEKVGSESRIKKGAILNGLKPIKFENSLLSNNFMIPLSKERIDKLFKILLKFENKFKDVLKDLNVILFTDLIENKNIYGPLSHDILSYLNINQSGVSANDEFLNHLKYLSNYYSYVMPRDSVQPKDINVSTEKNEKFYNQK
jgi:hypothetical protein